MSQLKPTVLVLGAGASHSYGFPLGPGLKNKIVSHLNRKTFELLASVGFEKPVVQAFGKALKYSQHGTIDIFLEHKTSLRKLGSHLIASTLIPLENEDNLFLEKCWYRDLYDAIHFDKNEPDTSSLSVVTLNYDRSFEHFMTKSIDFNIHDDLVSDAHNKMSKIRVVHAHGSLGQYPEVSFGIKPTNKMDFQQAAENIRIISDKLYDSPDFIAAQDLIENARNVVFLGFGYNEQTLEALLHNADMQNTNFFGTAFNLPPDKRNKVSELFKGRISLGTQSQDCAAYLRQVVLEQMF